MQSNITTLNIKVTEIPIVIGAFGTVTKGLIPGMEDLEIRRPVETIQTTALLRLASLNKVYSLHVKKVLSSNSM